MKNEIVVSVSQSHINNGDISSCETDPIALALKEQFPDSKICVGGFYITIDDKTYQTPRVARHFLVSIEQKRPVKPFEFNLVIH